MKIYIDDLSYSRKLLNQEIITFWQHIEKCKITNFWMIFTTTVFCACKVYLNDGNKIVFVTDVKKETSKFFPGAVK